MRPAPQIYVWGAGNFGQFGMGSDKLGHYSKPTRNKLMELMIEEGVFGDNKGAGIKAAAAGGLHTLFIDEKGTVNILYTPAGRMIAFTDFI